MSFVAVGKNKSVNRIRKGGNMADYALGDKILIDGKRKGTIAGPAVVVQTTKGEIRPCYPVELDEGFYNAGETLWTSVLLVNESNLTIR